MPTKQSQRRIFCRDKKKGTLFVISGPSGCGKTTLCRRLLKEKPDLISSISVTTRLPRKGERRNIDYIYITEKEFKKRLKKKGFLEYASVFGNHYGTPNRPVIDALEKGKDVLLNIDVQGAAQIKRTFKEAVFIFILPPAFGDLEERLLKRSSDTALQIKKRLKIAYLELRAIGRYDYAVVNDDMTEAAKRLVAIVTAERSRMRRSFASLKMTGRNIN